MFYIIRPMKPTDATFLSEFLYQALYIPPEASPLPKDVVWSPELAKYIRNWGRNDLGFIAVLNNQIPIGAAWLRLFTKEDRGYGYINDRIPELSISLLPEYRGRGIGSKLLTELLDRAKQFYWAVSISVSLDNPALRLYQRFGFKVYRQQENSLIMKKRL